MSSNRGHVVLANESAGGTERAAIGVALTTLAEHGPVELTWTTDVDDIDAAIAELGDRRLVVAGGDGTLHLVVNRLERTGRLDGPPTGESAIGLVPLGTGNDLARGVGIPLDPAEAADRIVAGRSRPVPVLQLSTGELAVNNAHLGVGVVAAERGRRLKPWLGRFAYRVGAAAAGARPPTIGVRVDVDDDILHDGPAMFVMMALGPSAGGGTELDPTVDSLEPEVEVLVVPHVGVAERLTLVGDALRGSLPGAEAVAARQGRRVAITLDQPTTATVDGEFRTWDGTVGLEVVPGRWSIRC